MIEHEIKIPLVFKVQYLPSRRHSKPLNIFAHEMVTVTVREADAAEAPIATRYDKYKAPDGKLAIRWLNGEFYRPIYDSRWSGRPAQYLIAQELREFSEAGRPYYNPLFRDLTLYGYEEHTRSPTPEVSTLPIIRWSGRDEALQKLMATAKDLLVVDGLTYERIGMPVYSVSDKGFFERSVSVDIGPIEEFKDRSTTTIFPLTRFQDAQEHAARHLGVTLPADDAAEILIPGVFTFDEATPATLELLTKSVDAHFKDIGHADKATAMAWYDFRDATTLALESKSETQIDAAIYQFGEAYRNSPAPRTQSLEYLDKAIERWNNRALAGPSL